MVNDEWQTTLEGWRPISTLLLPILKKKKVWQPFFYDGECAKHLVELGFKHVLHSKEDFFMKIKDPEFMSGVDVIFDNPPYTSPETKQKVLEGLKSTGKPFCMLLPLAVVHA